MSWTDEEKCALVELYQSHTDKELCSILNKTSGQIRGMKERMHLHGKYKAVTEEEKAIIKDWYLSHPGVLDLDELSIIVGRPKTTISRCARELGLTINNRPLSEAAIEKSKESKARYMSSDDYQNTVKPAQAKLLSYYAKNEHPRGMLGKHHNAEAKRRISAAMVTMWATMELSDRNALILRMKNGNAANGGHKSTYNTYSRCHGGFREDIGLYFRSSWEANYARLLNHIGVKWEYEGQRFRFPDTGCGVLSYCPDFYLPEFYLFIEIKGWMDERSRIRLGLFEKYYPEQFRNLLIIQEREYTQLQRLYMSEISEWE